MTREMQLEIENAKLKNQIAVIEFEKFLKIRSNATIQKGWHTSQCPVFLWLDLLENGNMNPGKRGDCNCKEI